MKLSAIPKLNLKRNGFQTARHSSHCTQRESRSNSMINHDTSTSKPKAQAVIDNKSLKREAAPPKQKSQLCLQPVSKQSLAHVPLNQPSSIKHYHQETKGRMLTKQPSTKSSQVLVVSTSTRQPSIKNRQPIISKQKQKNSDKMKELMLANNTQQKIQKKDETQTLTVQAATVKSVQKITNS